MNSPRRAALILLVLLGVVVPGAAAPADRIVAVVANQVILESQVKAGVDMLKLSTLSPDTTRKTPPDSVLRAQVLNELISDQVILEQAKRESVNVAKETVDDEIETALKKIKARFSTPDSFTLALQQEGLTEAMLRQRYRDEITQRLTAQQLLAKHNLLENILVTPVELQQFYAGHRDSFGSVPGRVRLAHILVMPKPEEEAEKAAYEQIVQAWVGLSQSGWDFDAIAASFSNNSEVKRRSGSMGTVERGELSPETDSILFSLKVGEFSKPFRAMRGWQILKREGGTGDRAVARQVLIEVPTSAADTNRALELAREVGRKAAAGDSFSVLAAGYSDDPMTRTVGGALGEFFLKGLAEPYASAVESLKTGEVSRPIQSQHGFHVIKVIERVDEKVPTYEELQEDMRNYIYAQKLKAKIDDFVKVHAAKISITRY